ncbi:MAG: hypothetical protein Q7R91_01635 [bacterium]|nr:hypothetical protein [bacterium]
MKFFLFSVAFIAVLVLAPAASHVSLAEPNPTSIVVPTSITSGTTGAKPTTATGYLDYLYTWMLGFVGIAALFAIVYGGVLYIFSGAIESTAEARRWITNAIIGLLIAGGSYVILRTINPDLVKKFDVQTIIQKNR